MPFTESLAGSAMVKIRFVDFTVSRDDNIKSLAKKARKGAKPRQFNMGLTATVSSIIQDVRKNGDAALIRLGNRFDRTHFSRPDELFVKAHEFKHAYTALSAKQITSLKLALQQIRWLARSQMKRYKPVNYRTPLGFVIKERFEPLGRIGGYVPGGLAAYPSTVLMICGPAIESRVGEIILATPPRPDGSINESVLVAADLCGVRDILKGGGAQAIAALAFGTHSINRANLIAGPGNEFVTEAKRQVSGIGAASIDMLAGPTELLVVANGDVDPRLVAEDLISQAEHGNRTICGVISESDELISKVRSTVRSSRNRSRAEYIAESLFFSVKVRTADEALRFAHEFSPEHLEIMLPPGAYSTSEKYHKLAKSAGLALVGENTPTSATDYIVGTNHILPTGGLAEREAGLSVETFLKRVTTVYSSKRALHRSVEPLSVLASLEGLQNHALAAQARFI